MGRMTETPSAPDTAADTEWGNPALKTYKKRYIRNVRTPNGSTWVHNELADIVREIFTAAPLPLGEVDGYVAPPEDVTEITDPRSYGVVLHLPWSEAYKAWGFADFGGMGIIFTGSIDDARASSELALSLQAARAAEVEPVPTVGEWHHGRPGTRELEPGMKGDDVQFIQLVTGVKDDGVYGRETAAAVQYLQTRFNPYAEATEGVSEALWAAILPKHTKFSLSRGDSGFKVRVLQALLAAYDWAAPDSVTGRYGVATSRSVKRLQANAGLRVNGLVRAPEWAYLLGNGARGELVEGPQVPALRLAS
jgi:peptidoglycan hydrolase-like protein with peptidoglycan-binding domain